MSSPTSALLQRLSRPESRRKGHDPVWLKEFRHAAFQWVSERGFPTVRDEAWKYTGVGPILKVAFEPAEPAPNRLLSSAAIDQLAGNLGGIRLVFVNGHFAPQCSSLKKPLLGAKAESLASALAEEGESLEAFFSRPFAEQTHAFTALNAACIEDGAFVRIPANTTIEEPIHLVFLSDASATVTAGPVVSHPRSLLLAGTGSRATIVETYIGLPGEVTLTNAVTEVVLDEGAAIEHYKVQNETETGFHIALLDVRQERDTRFTTHSFALGSSLARHEVAVRLQGPGAETTVNGLYMPRNRQHLDNPTMIDHIAPECTSRELYKGVIDGRGRGVFDGRVVVRPGAMNTDSSQTNKNLLLSESAQANTRPRLEIFADDVKCAHGAAVGQLDEEAVFYLRSRGIQEPAARDLLTYAFIDEMLELIRLAPLRSHVEKLVASRLPAGGVAVAA
ncbi:MAG: Fe-S cluster assembly protein SufD [Planctomycetota bacterium]|jgi:Fe-S cluster assembly protein SufD